MLGPSNKQAVTEVAEPRMGLVFIISIMAAVFNMFVCVLDHFLFLFFPFFVACNFFFFFKTNQFD